MGRIFRQLTITDRRKIEKMYLSGEKAKDMADTLRVNVSTIYRELKRGRYMHRNSDWTETERYSADIAEEKYQENLKAKGPVLKIGKDIDLANYPVCRKTPCFSYGDIRHFHRIYASN